MKAVIMAGGKGTRLYPLTRRIPKPMMPLLDRPVMEYMIDLLHRNGIREVGVSLGHLPDSIRMYFGDGSRFLVRMTYAIEKSPLGTAGGIKNFQDFLDEPFVVASGDGVTDINLQEAIDAHKQNGALVTIILTQVTNPTGFGVVVTDDTGRVVHFIEKPTTWDASTMYYANTGIYIMEPEVLSFIPRDRPYDFGHELFPRLLQLGMPIYGHHATGYWSDIGTLQQYYQTQLDLLSGKIHLPLSEDVLLANAQ
jgi:mannose-1-phosphate guanylyltransferase/phosphomannomutase